MSEPSSTAAPRRRWPALFLLIVVLAGAGVAAYFYLRPSLPGRDSPLYKQYVQEFDVGVAEVHSGESAAKALERAAAASLDRRAAG